MTAAWGYDVMINSCRPLIVVLYLASLVIRITIKLHWLCYVGEYYHVPDWFEE